MVAMFLLDWRLALFALGLLPFFVWLTRRVGEERRRITAVRQETLADISTLVEESLSVSGILLGKTMGRAPELAERFEGESRRLADLEVRSRMAGRWRMALGADELRRHAGAVYWFAGLAIAQRRRAITIGTLVAFTTLQTRLFFPVRSLLSVGVDVQTSLALFERVFEYLDLPVEIDEKAGRARPSDEARRRRLRGRLVPLRADGPWTLQDVDLDGAGRDDAGARGRDGLGQDDARLPARAPLRRRARARHDRRRRRARPDASPRSPTVVGVVSQETYLFHASIARQPALREARRDRRGDRGRRRAPRRSTT